MKHDLAALAALARLCLACASALIALVFLTPLLGPGRAGTARFAFEVQDRPVLETVRQVRDARITGVSEFDFDGVHYVVESLPEEYVDYSSRYCRMP